MKIDGLNPLEGKPVDRPKSNEPTDGSRFSDVLDSLTPSGVTGKTGSAGPIPQMPFIQPPLSTGSNTSTLEITGSIESMLTDLDMFLNALGNGDIPLERLQPLARELMARKDDLAALLGSTPDDELKSLVSGTLELVINHMNQYHQGYAA